MPGPTYPAARAAAPRIHERFEQQHDGRHPDGLRQALDEHAPGEGDGDDKSGVGVDHADGR
jgi:hypothetical protein